MKKSEKTVSFEEKKQKADRIRAKIAELSDKRNATEEKWKNADPMEKVALEKKMQQESDAMMLLQEELAKTEEVVVNNMQPPEDDRPLIFAGIQKYIQEDEEKHQKVLDQHNAIIEQINKAEAKLTAATQSADLLAMGKAKQEKEDAEKALEYEKELVKVVEQSKTFPEGAIVEEWKKCCELRRAKWESELKNIQLFASAYKLAVKKFLDLHNDMTRIRSEMRQFSIELDGVSVNFPIVLTPSRSAFEQNEFLNSIQITKQEGSEISRAFRAGQVL